MIEEILLAFWGFWLLLILVAAFRVLGFNLARRRQDRRWGDGAGRQQPVVLVVSVKGFDLQSTPRFFDTIFDQTYRDYRVIICFESWEDPVARWLCEHLELGPQHRVWTHPDPASGLRSVTLACGGLATDEGQKVRNQRAALEDLGSRDAIVAFADADILCGRDWLARLVAPINRGDYELATTYRWLIPKRPTLPNQVASVINASIATQGGNTLTNILWGGSMALTRGLFDEIDVPNLLKGSLNDDLRISKRARATGRKVAFVRSLVVPTPVDFTWRTFFEFARRQYTQFKFFSPILYTATNLVMGLYILGAVSIVGALVYGYFFAWIPVAAAYVIDQFRALARQQIYLSLFPDNATRQKLFAASWLEHMFTPFWMTLHWLLLASTWTQSRITWAGVSYHILSKSKTRVLRRAPASTMLPAGAPGLAMIGDLHDRWRPLAAPVSRPPIAVASAAQIPAAVTEAPVAGVVAPVPAAAAPVSATAPAAFSAAVAHPGAPSAVLALTTAFHERPARIPLRPPAQERGGLSAVVFALLKTRVIPFRRYDTPPPPRHPAGGMMTLSAPEARSFRRPLTVAERMQCKTRLAGGSAVARPERVVAGAPSRLPAPVARLAAKTRLLVGNRPMKAGGQPPRPVVVKPSQRIHASRETSFAARRVGGGVVHRNGHPRKAVPARSSRAAPAPRFAGNCVARPMPRGASARP